jgi:hypothetical protein
METFRIVIEIVKENKRWECCHKTKQLDEIKSFVCLLKLLVPYGNMTILKIIIHVVCCIIYCTWMLFLYIYILFKILSFSKLKISKKNCEGKYIVFYNIQEYFTFYIESSNSLIILQNICVEINLVL